MRLQPLAHVALLLAVLLACKDAKKTRSGPQIVASSVEITRDYVTMGIAAADAKWADKNIKVTGVAYITMGCQEDPLARAFSGEHKPTDEVNCLMLEGYDQGGGRALMWLRTWLAPQPTKQIQVGSAMTLQCHVPEEFASQGGEGIVSVQDCTILSTGAPTTKAPRTAPPSSPARKPPSRKR